MSHTKDWVSEPWQCIVEYTDPDGDVIKSASVGKICTWGGFTIVDVSHEVPEDSRAGCARRIKACVNACAGINPEAVPELLRVMKAAKRFFEEESDSYRVAPLFDDICFALDKAERVKP